MKKRMIALAAALNLLAGAAFAQSGIVTLTRDDIAGLMNSVCGPQGVPSGNVHVHRSAQGNMIYIVAEGQHEGLIYSNQQACNPLSKETINLWRNMNDGAVIAQLAHRYGEQRLLVQGSFDGISGKHFDIEPGGNYLLISHGTVSSVSPVSRPYVRTVELQIDARRIFTRQGGLLVVGNDTASNQLVAIPVTMQGNAGVAGQPIVVPGVPAGVTVLDYNDRTHELLLGGVGAAGSQSFAIANLASGQARMVDNAKPGAVTALFIDDSSLLSRLRGQAVPAGPAGAQPGAAQPQSGGGLFGIFRRN